MKCTLLVKQISLVQYLIDSDKITLLDGKFIGIKSNYNKPILLEDLLEEKFLDIHHDAFGIYIPKDEVLIRNKYEWFAVMSKKELFDSKSCYCTLLKII